nr:uncharacterized protein LOC109162082 isoform X1 [Ipomoea trifida]
MHSTTVTPWQNCCYCPVPSRFTSSPHSLPFPKKAIRLSRLTLSAATTHSCSTEHEKQNLPRNPEDPDRENPVFPQDYYEDGDREPERRFENPLVFLTNMWWTDMKAALGQRINVEGLTSSLGIFAKKKHLVIPHIAVPDIRYIDWAELKRRGFEGVVFDKDNTLTFPYSLRLWSPLRSSIEQCKALFGNNIAVFSNSSGLFEYDPDGRNAKILERAIGIKVIRHRLKKPAGTAEEIERQFGCEASKLIMVGDRPFTDIVYGNRNGFLTILTEPLSLDEEPFIVHQICEEIDYAHYVIFVILSNSFVRVIERALVYQWSVRGVQPISHKLLPDCEQCVKDKPN